MEKGELPFAKVQAEKAVKIEEADRTKYNGSNVGHMLRGLVALWEKRWDDAGKDFEVVILEVPNDFGAKNNLALALVEQRRPGQEETGVGIMRWAIISANNKTTLEALSTLGWVYFRRGEFDKAALALEQGIKATGGLNNADTATYWAHILHHRDRDWEAKEMLENLLKSERPFSMRPEAEELYEKVKDAKKPARNLHVNSGRDPEEPLRPQIPGILKCLIGAAVGTAAPLHFLEAVPRNAKDHGTTFHRHTMIFILK